MAEYIDKAKLYNTIAKLEEKARKHYLGNLESSVLSENAERAFARLSERIAFKHLVADFRAADVVPVVHVVPVRKNRPKKYEWYEEVKTENGEILYKKHVYVDETNWAEYCPACGKRLCSRFKSYCPSCGAIMDLEESK